MITESSHLLGHAGPTIQLPQANDWFGRAETGDRGDRRLFSRVYVAERLAPTEPDLLRRWTPQRGLLITGPQSTAMTARSGHVFDNVLPLDLAAFLHACDLAPSIDP